MTDTQVLCDYVVQKLTKEPTSVTLGLGFFSVLFVFDNKTIPIYLIYYDEVIDIFVSTNRINSFDLRDTKSIDSACSLMNKVLTR